MNRQIAWVDGVNSAVMCHLMIKEGMSVLPAHCELGDSVHEDSMRFINDIERWYDRKVIRIKSEEYDNIDQVFEKKKYLSGVNGAPCTGAMKFVPRLNFQLPSDTHLWGYTADKKDAVRFKHMKENYPELNQRSPLIEFGLTKTDTHRMLRDAGIKRPYVYEIGYPNGNCLGCVKASSPNYWALTRKHFPEVFAKRADQSRRFGARLTRIKGERVFIDEIPEDWPTTMRGQKMASCGFLCEQET